MGNEEEQPREAEDIDVVRDEPTVRDFSVEAFVDGDEEEWPCV